MQIGPYKLENNLILAPMAGVTDRPFRELCRELGAGLAVSEMLSSNPRVWNTAKSQARMNHEGESGLRSVQIAGSEPGLMAEAAQFNVQNGAQVIDINMGCPAKKVNKKLAGSALLQQPKLVAEILEAVTTAVDVPVTLKIRTGWHPDHRNGVEIAKIAEQSGIQALAIHGRTRACLFKGEAEYETIAQIKQSVSIPIIANGDITDEFKAKEVLRKTGADALMIGRAAQGNPWIFKQVEYFLKTGEVLERPSIEEQASKLLSHVKGIHELYGEYSGLRIARKHVGWYLKNIGETRDFRSQFNSIEDATEQLDKLTSFFSMLRDTDNVSEVA